MVEPDLGQHDLPRVLKPPQVDRTRNTPGIVTVDRNGVAGVVGNRHDRALVVRVQRPPIRKLIRTGFEDGSLRKCDDLLVAQMLYGVINAMAKWLAPGSKTSAAAALDGMFDIIVGG